MNEFKIGDKAWVVYAYPFLSVEKIVIENIEKYPYFQTEYNGIPENRVFSEKEKAIECKQRFARELREMMMRCGKRYIRKMR